MGKNPAFQFYPGDWLREPGLQRVDLDVRGAWAELLMIMHFENPRGVSHGSISGIARQLRITVPRACHIIAELNLNKIADVEYFDDESKRFIEDTAYAYSGDMSPDCPEVSPEFPYYVTIKNRRMVNEEKEREYERLKKQKQRRPQEVPKNVPEKSLPLLQSPSPSTPKDPSPKTKEPSLPLAADGNGKGHTKEVVLFWSEMFEKKRGQKPHITWGRHMDASKRLLADQSLDTVKWMITELFDGPPDIVKTKGLYDLGILLGPVGNSILARRRRA